MSSEIVLVVDDEPLNVRLVRFVLEGEHYVVHEASSAEEALRKIDEVSPHLVLLDMNLPGMSGFELARLLRADPRHAQLRLLATTAHTSPTDVARTLDAGCDDYIGKPLDLVALRRVVSRLIR